MITSKKKNLRAKLLIVLVAFLSLLAVFTKGWLIFFLLPVSVILLPLYIIIEFIALKQQEGPYLKWIKYMRHILTASLFVSYLAFPGVYDVPGGVLLGFIIVDNDTLVYSLYGLGIGAFIIASISLLTLFVLLIGNHHKKAK